MFPILSKIVLLLALAGTRHEWIFVDTTHNWTLRNRHLYLGAQGPLKIRTAAKNDSDGCTDFLKLGEFY